MATFINTRDTMPGSTNEERAQKVLDGLVSHTLTEFREDGLKNIRTGCFQGNDTLKIVELPNLLDTSRNLFSFNTALEYVNIEKATSIRQQCFRGCTALKSVKLFSLTDIEDTSFMDSGLEILDTGNNGAVKLIIDSGALKQSKIKHFIIRNAVLAQLSHTAAFYQNPIALNQGGIYVPSELLDSYKNATNWSTFASNIYPIVFDENNEVILKTNFDSIEDSWEDILAAEEDGTYNTKYSIGDTKSVEIENKPVIMRIAAFDTDTITGTNNKAKITWICDNLYISQKRMNSTNTTTGGWPATEMYSYLNDSTNSIYNNIDPTVRAAIKTVVKAYWDAAENVEKTSNDKLWLLSIQEVNCITASNYHRENNGVTYSGLFPTATNSSIANRTKCDDSFTFSYWWLRSSYNSQDFVRIDSSGSTNHYSASGIYGGIVFGFCT